LFEIDGTQLDQSFLNYFIRTPAFHDQVAAQGSTNYAAIRAYDVLEYEIPLPPLDEQRRLVARIEALAAKIEEARGLRRSAVEEAEVLVARASTAALDDAGWELKLLESVLAESPRNGLSPQKETPDGGRPMLRINAVSSSPTRFVDLTAHKTVDVSDEIAKPFTLRHDDVFIVRYNGDINRVAKAGIYKGDDTNIVYPDKLMRLRVDYKQIYPDFLVYALGSRQVRNQIEELGKTTAGQIGVSGSDAKSFLIPVPLLEEQRRIVAYLDGLQARVDALKALRAQTQAELDALLPSVLDKAFKGEL
jgi:type I restriction enzyme S subunit